MPCGPVLCPGTDRLRPYGGPDVGAYVAVALKGDGGAMELQLGMVVTRTLVLARPGHVKDKGQVHIDVRYDDGDQDKFVLGHDYIFILHAACDRSYGLLKEGEVDSAIDIAATLSMYGPEKADKVYQAYQRAGGSVARGAEGSVEGSGAVGTELEIHTHQSDSNLHGKYVLVEKATYLGFANAMMQVAMDMQAAAQPDQSSILQHSAQAMQDLVVRKRCLGCRSLAPEQGRGFRLGGQYCFKCYRNILAKRKGNKHE